MITVSVSFMLYLDSSPELSIGKKVFDMEIDDGATFVELLEGLEPSFGPALAEEIYDSKKQQLQELVKAILNGVLVQNLDGMRTVLKHGDTIVFVPLVMGG